MANILATKIDKCGRVVIPAPIRNFLGYDIGSEFEVTHDNKGNIILIPLQDNDVCPLCKKPRRSQ